MMELTSRSSSICSWKPLSADKLIRHCNAALATWGWSPSSLASLCATRASLRAGHCVVSATTPTKLTATCNRTCETRFTLHPCTSSTVVVSASRHARPSNAIASRLRGCESGRKRVPQPPTDPTSLKHPFGCVIGCKSGRKVALVKQPRGKALRCPRHTCLQPATAPGRRLGLSHAMP